MLNRVFLAVAVAAVLFTGCDSDSSTSPKREDLPESSSAGDLSSSSVALSSSSRRDTELPKDLGENKNSGEVAQGDTIVGYGMDDPFNVGCSVHVVSGNSFMIAMKQGVATTYITTIVSGYNIVYDYEMVFVDSIPSTYVQLMCETVKEDSDENARVTCIDHKVLIHTQSDSEMDFEEALKSADDFCEQINSGIDMDTGMVSFPLDNLLQTKDKKDTLQKVGNATCQVTEDTKTSFKMVAADPDSASETISLELQNDSIFVLAEFEFVERIPQSTADAFCEEMKEDEDQAFQIVCDGRRFTETGILDLGSEFFGEIVNEMKKSCNRIQKTGNFFDDDDF